MPNTPSTFDKESARLAKMPRAERFKELIEFPTCHSFTLIGHSSGFSDAVQSILIAAGHSGVVFMERPSAKGRYVSLTFQIKVQSGEDLDALYSAFEKTPGLAYIL